VIELESRILREFGFTVRMCGEIECYIIGMDAGREEDFWQAVTDQCAARGVSLGSIARERGEGQFECRMNPTYAAEAAQALVDLKHIIHECAADHRLAADFSALPYPTKPGSGLHWHLHLENAQGQHQFLKQEERLSPPLSATLGGLLQTLFAMMPFFASQDASYARLQSGQDHVPVAASWGGNNRSAALRMPESVIPLRHIEHRVCGADADPYASAWAVLVGIHYGLARQPDPGPQMFGNAGDAKYGLPRIPLSYEESYEAFRQAEWVQDYL
jgi:glutamine synthetase